MNRYASFCLSTPIHIVFIVLLVFFFGSYIPEWGMRSAYTVSFIIKDLLLTILPIAVSVYIASTLISFRQNALLLVIVLLLFEAISNATSIMYAYGAALLFENWIPVFKGGSEQLVSVRPYFTISALRPAFWSSFNGVILGTFFGIVGSFLKTGFFTQIIFKLRESMITIFSRIFVRLIPLYVLGFLLHMHHSGLFQRIIESYITIIIMVTLIIFTYFCLITLLASKLVQKKFSTIIANLWPAGLIAFTSGSSAATMPFTIVATEKNLKSPKFANMLIPATTNIQQIGDCIANTLLCLVILKNFGKPIPDVWAWVPFMVSFTLVRYTTSAMLGGAIFLMTPLYEFYLGFTSEMVALIIALNVVLDPIITSTNVLCNGSLAIVFEHIWLFISTGEKSGDVKNASLTIEYPYTREEARAAKK